MKISKKQQHTIEIARYFSSPPQSTEVDDWSLSYYDATTVKVGDQTPEEAFLLRTDKGVVDVRPTNIAEYIRLLIGHNAAARQIKQWSEGFREGSLYLADFEDESESIKELAQKAYEASFSDRYDYIEQLGSWYNEMKLNRKVSYFQKLFRTDKNYRGLKGWHKLRKMMKRDSGAFKVIIDNEDMGAVRRIQYSSLVFFQRDGERSLKQDFNSILKKIGL